jgi:hypothetical protein
LLVLKLKAAFLCAFMQHTLIAKPSAIQRRQSDAPNRVVTLALGLKAKAHGFLALYSDYGFFYFLCPPYPKK